jgi:hypothetical protein
MKTETIKTAVIAALLSDKPSLKISDKLSAAINTAITDNLPEQPSDRPSESALSAFSKALSERGILLDSQNFLLAHIPESQLFSRTEGQDRELVAGHDYILELKPTWDTVLQLATAIISQYKRARPDKLSQGNNLSLHLAAEGLEALQILNGDLATTKTSAKTSADYAEVAATLGIPASIFNLGSSYMLPPKGAGLIIETDKINGALLLVLLERSPDFAKAQSWLCNRCTVTRTPRQTTDPDTLDIEVTGYGFTFRPKL